MSIESDSNCQSEALKQEIGWQTILWRIRMEISPGITVAGREPIPDTEERTLIFANFRFMDRGISVYASANGRVVCLHDGEPDRNTSRHRHEGYGNYVEIRHPNGYASRYGHLKNGSISVERGQSVAARQRIGAIGSSGSSDGPHLHFALTDRDGCCVDPCQRGYWINAPEYDPPFSIMDLSVQKGIENLVRTKAPTIENITSFFAGEWITVGDFLSGLRTEKIAVGMQVGSRPCVKVLGSDTRDRKPYDILGSILFSRAWTRFDSGFEGPSANPRLGIGSAVPHQSVGRMAPCVVGSAIAGCGRRRAGRSGRSRVPMRKCSIPNQRVAAAAALAGHEPPLEQSTGGSASGARLSIVMDGGDQRCGRPGRGCLARSG